MNELIVSQTNLDYIPLCHTRLSRATILKERKRLEKKKGLQYLKTVESNCEESKGGKCWVVNARQFDEMID